jgi:hypothetical protein
MNEPVIEIQTQHKYPEFLGIDALNWAIIGFFLVIVVLFVWGVRALGRHEERQQAAENKLMAVARAHKVLKS